MAAKPRPPKRDIWAGVRPEDKEALLDALIASAESLQARRQAEAEAARESNTGKEVA